MMPQYVVIVVCRRRREGRHDDRRINLKIRTKRIRRSPDPSSPSRPPAARPPGEAFQAQPAGVPHPGRLLRFTPYFLASLPASHTYVAGSLKYVTVTSHRIGLIVTGTRLATSNQPM